MDLDPQQRQLKKLIAGHDAIKGRIAELNAYYEGKQPLSYLAPELLVEMQDRIRNVVINWPRLIVDTLDERLDVEGFRLAGQAGTDDRLWRIWQANDLDECSQQGHVDALAMKRSYAIVGANGDEPDEPIITVESPLDVYADNDPRTRQVRAAVKRWKDDPDPDSGSTLQVDHATLYLPDQTSWWVKGSDGVWALDEVAGGVDDHELGAVPVVPIVNRPRIKKPWGTSELADVLPLSDAACKIATDMMVSAEFHAMPRRWALGFGAEDFQDQDGNPVSTWSKVAGRIWATDKTRAEGAEVGQFPEANLKNFHDTITALAKLVSSLTGLPPQFLGEVATNPASADAIRSSETRLVKRAERKQRVFGGSWERVMRLALRIATGEWDPTLRRMETVWRNAATPTEAETADAAVKGYQAGVVPLRQTRERMGFSAEQIRLMESEDAAQAAREARMLKLEPQQDVQTRVTERVVVPPVEGDVPAA